MKCVAKKRVEIGFGVKYTALKTKLATNNAYIPSLYIYLVHTRDRNEYIITRCVCSHT